MRRVVGELDLVDEPIVESATAPLTFVFACLTAGQCGAFTGRDRGEARVAEEGDEADDPNDDHEDQATVAAPAKRVHYEVGAVLAGE